MKFCPYHPVWVHISLLTVLGFLNACSTGSTTAGTAGEAEEMLTLANTRWQLVRIQSMDDSVYTPDDPVKYQISFLPEGQLAVIADCNRGQGKWVRNASQLVFSRMITTLASCGPESLYTRFMDNLNFVRSFVYQDGHLFLATLADGAILEFAPANPAAPAFD